MEIAGFWGEMQDRVREVTIPYQHDALHDRVRGADRSGAVRNFRIAAGKAKGDHYGFVFQDSDVAKWIEAAAYALRTRPDPALERRVDRLISLIAESQAEDGYLNTAFTIKNSDQRWSDLRDNHELYVSGHMIEAAVAYYESTGKGRLLEVMKRNVDLIDRRFGREKGQQRGYPGHPEIELALIRLYRLTDDPKHLALATYFVDERGRRPRYFDQEAKRLGKEDFRSLDWYGYYNQSHQPVREQKEVVGHAVRAGYLFSAVTDVAVETGDTGLLRASRRLWRNATERRMYLTGGVGSTLLGEAFTFDYDLPNEWAYTETCAAIALVMWSKRLLEHDLDSKYADVIERTLYNNILAALSVDGKHCFYRNPLASKPDPKYPKRHIRRTWHECACCPPNLARFVMSLGDYVFTLRKRSVFVHLFVDGRKEFELGQKRITIVQKTDYPWSGKTTITIQTDSPVRFTLAVRIPAWVRSPGLTLNGESIKIQPITKKGYAKLTRTWYSGDKVKLEFPLLIEQVRAHPKVRQDAGKVALQRGPVVYCLEEIDNGADLHEIELPEEPMLKVSMESGELGKHPVITGPAIRRRTDTGDRLYSPDVSRKQRRVRIRAVPYYLWANRGMGEMIVWMRDGAAI
jgi:hypothetical protein